MSYSCLELLLWLLLLLLWHQLLLPQFIAASSCCCCCSCCPWDIVAIAIGGERQSLLNGLSLIEYKRPAMSDRGLMLLLQELLQLLPLPLL